MSYRRHIGVAGSHDLARHAVIGSVPPRNHALVTDSSELGAAELQLRDALNRLLNLTGSKETRRIGHRGAGGPATAPRMLNGATF